MTSLKLVADKQLRQLTLTLTLTLLTLTPDCNLFCTDNSPFATGNEHIANGVSCSRMSVIFYILNADSGR